ncbi:hypothetical protein B0J17DRAFT_718515 [Rhizoctonia solani]|nr:hypothetical protein B0J17DRAFT_718515 [Rhizoctonia solani]
MSTSHPPPSSRSAFLDPALRSLPDNMFLFGESLAGIPVSTDPKRILEACPNLFQLLELVTERGFDIFNGPVEKIVIAQESFGRCLNVPQPGSYTSISKIDLKSLDKLSIKPTGIYGDPLEIIMFLQKVGYLQPNPAAVLFQAIISSSPNAVLSSGLYLALDPKHGAQSSKSAYIIYWPENTMWDDQAASYSVRHNQITFMHHLNKLTDQTISLVSASQATETINNSLIDCHLEAWTRFPVVPAVARNTLTAIDRQPRQLIFASPISLQGVEEYFSRMISTLEATTRKPMAGTLTAIEVKSTNKTGSDTMNKTSEFKLGSFIVELLCLIPLHLAVTRENRFIPLKDGVWDPEYERSLLGADVAASLTLSA